MIFGFWIGYIVDKFPRLLTISILLVVQKASIIAISIFLWKLNHFGFGEVERSENILNLSYWIVVLFGVILRVANLGTQIAIEKDWIMTLSTSHEHLSELNTKMKRVDLFCKLVTPIVISFVVDYTSMAITIISITIISTVSGIAELILVARVYHSTPKLKQKRQIPLESNIETKSTSSLKKIIKRPVFKTVVAVALLYMNVLAFGPVMISYLFYRSFSATLVSGMRAIAVIIGLSSTFTFTYFEKKFGLVRFGLWSIWSELTCLTIALASFAVRNDLISIIMLIGGVALSRWGLYSFDLVQTQLLQEEYFIINKVVLS